MDDSSDPIAAPDGSPPPPPGCPVVGLGASAGGIEAISQLLRALPAPPGLAIVVILHLSPDHPSHLAEVLDRCSPIPVLTAGEGTALAPDHVYVVPACADLTVHAGTLHLLTRGDAPGRHKPINTFFDALATDQGSQAVGIVLSGADTDGAAGIKAIKAAGGITIAQDPTTARFSAMPTAAIRHGGADLTLSPEAIADRLYRLRRPLAVTGPPDEAAPPATGAPDITDVLMQVQSHTGVAFSAYKRSTLQRRIARRMALAGVDSVAAYLQILQGHAGEMQALYDDLLINVTSFFRDPEVFEALKAQVLPALLGQPRNGRPLRFWVPGCATGEEVYSLAIVLLELLEETAPSLPVQLFATDVSESAVAAGRQGFYTDEAVAPISPERLHRFFTQVPGGYRVNKAVRDLCLFVRHDLTSDPPFSKLDLISCRNVLIYFGRPLQQRVAQMFHYALNPGGILVVGQAGGNTAEFGNFFSILDKAHQIYQRKATRTPPLMTPDHFRHRPDLAPPIGATPSPAPAVTSIQHLADAMLLERYAPAGVLIDDSMAILQFRGDMGPYLAPQQGVAELNLFKMVKPSLLAELRLAIHGARKAGEPARRDRVPLGPDPVQPLVDIQVLPIQTAPPAQDVYLLVLFEPRAVRRPGAVVPETPPATDDSQRNLETELVATREMLTSVIEQYEAANEELYAANEESVTANEELQSINEELETAKEELQAANEELTTVNDELHARNLELNQLNSDLSNLLSSIDIAIVMLDPERRIRRFTPKARSSFNLIPSDVGRPIGDIRPAFATAGLDALVAAVATDGAPSIQEVQDEAGHWFSLHVSPYLTPDGTRSGTVLALFDVDSLKSAAAAADAARDFAKVVVETVPVPLLTLDADLRVRSANRTFYDTFALVPSETEGKLIYRAGNGQWDLPRLRDLLESHLAERAEVTNVEIRHHFPTGGDRTLLVSARTIHPGTEDDTLTVMAIQDISERAALMAQTQAAQAEAERASRAKDVFLATLSHELRTPLTTILGWLPLLREGRLDEAKTDQALKAIQHSAEAQSRLIEDLLDISSIAAGKIHLRPVACDVATTVQAAVAVIRPNAESAGVTIDVVAEPDLPAVMADPVRLQQVLWNLLSNAVTASPQGHRVSVRLSAGVGQVRIVVHDTGIGIDPGFLPHLFDQFSQATAEPLLPSKRLGLGLWLVRHLVELQGGTVAASSPGKGLGATFTIDLPTVGQPTVPPSDRPPTDPDDLTGIHVLLVEDDLPSQEVLAELLAQYGATVGTADTVDDALTAIDHRLPDIVVSDLSLPGKSGMDLMRTLRARPPANGGAVPAIAITAHGIHNLKPELEAAGFNAWTGKPIDVGRLLSLIAQHAHRRHP